MDSYLHQTDNYCKLSMMCQHSNNDSFNSAITANFYNKHIASFVAILAQVVLHKAL